MAKDQQEQVEEAAAVDGGARSRPVQKFSGSGGLNVAVWKHKMDDGRDSYSVRIDRNYKDSGGSFQATSYLRDGDLLRAQKLLSQADDWIEQDKVKQRSANRDQSIER